jgi:hypothetical protein
MPSLSFHSRRRPVAASLLRPSTPSPTRYSLNSWVLSGSVLLMPATVEYRDTEGLRV